MIPNLLLKKSCCRCPLRFSFIFIAYVALSLSTIAFLTTFAIMHVPTLKLDCFTLIYAMLVGLIGMVVSCIGIYGSNEEKHNLLIPFMLYMLLIALCLCIGLFSYVSYITSNLQELFIGLPITFILAIGITSYSFLIIVSHYSEICDKNELSYQHYSL